MSKEQQAKVGKGDSEGSSWLLASFVREVHAAVQHKLSLAKQHPIECEALDRCIKWHAVSVYYEHFTGAAASRYATVISA